PVRAHGPRRGSASRRRDEASRRARPARRSREASRRGGEGGRDPSLAICHAPASVSSGPHLQIGRPALDLHRQRERSMRKTAFLLAVAALAAHPAFAQTFDAVEAVDAQYDRTERVARQLWEWAEVG